MSESNYLYMHNISKSFPGVKALSNVDLEVRQGEVHALLGENCLLYTSFYATVKEVDPDTGEETTVITTELTQNDRVAVNFQILDKEELEKVHTCLLYTSTCNEYHCICNRRYNNYNSRNIYYYCSCWRSSIDVYKRQGSRRPVHQNASQGL